MSYNEDFASLLEMVLDEGQQAEEYKAKKAAEKKAEEDADEAQYQKRYGERRQETTLRGDDKKPGVKWDKMTSGGVQHDHVKNAKELTPDQKYEHAQKQHDAYGKAHIEVTKEAQKRDFDHDWGDDSKVPIHKMADTARASDALARHERRHPQNESALSTLRYMNESSDDFEALDEGARQKYIENLGKKQDEIKKEIKKQDALYKASTPGSKANKEIKEKLDNLRADYDSLADKASRYSAKVGIETRMTRNADGQYSDRNAGKHMNVNDRPYYASDGNENNRRRELEHVHDGKLVHYDKQDPKTGKYVRTEEDDPDAYVDEKRNINRAVKETKHDKEFGKNPEWGYDLGEYNRYDTRSYRQSGLTHEKGAKKNFEDDTGMSRQKEDKLAKKEPGSVLRAQEKRRSAKNESYEGLSELESLRLMNEGVEDPFLLESCGFDMALYENARKDARAIKTSEDAKKVKELMKESKKLAKSDPKAAIAKNKEAIKLLEKLKKDAQDIDDDTMGEYYANLIPSLASVVIMAFIPATAVTAWASVGIAGIIYDCIILGDLTKAETAIQSGLTKNKKPENKDDANKIGFERAKTVYYFNNMIKTLEKANEKLAEKAKATKAEKK